MKSDGKSDGTSASAYGFGAYLADRWWWILLALIAAASIALIGTVLGVAVAGVVLMVITLLLCFSVGLGLGYGRRKSFYRALSELSESVDRVALLPELMGSSVGTPRVAAIRATCSVTSGRSASRSPRPSKNFNGAAR